MAVILATEWMWMYVLVLVITESHEYYYLFSSALPSIQFYIFFRILRNHFLLMGIDQVYPCCWIGDAFDLEEEAQQSAAVLAVQREMEDADELNYLDEEGTFISVCWKLLDC